VTDSLLVALAEAYDVATEFTDWRGRPVQVPDSTVVAVLAALDVDAATPDARTRALEQARLQHWRRVLPPTVVQLVGSGAVVAVHCRHGDPIELRIKLEDGTERAVDEQLMVWVEPIDVDGELRGEATYKMPMDLPLGWHRLTAVTGSETATATLIVAPDIVGLGALGDRRAWGIATQLYSARSSRSWGMGDFGDLNTITSWAAERGAGFVLINPVHAAAPVSPIEPSPYYPSTRRFVSPLYLRVEEMKEYAAAGFGTRRRVDDARVVDDEDRIDRDQVWASKREAFALLWPVARDDPARMDELARFRSREGEGLERFALWCALAEQYGVPWQQWPRDLHRPDGGGIAAAQNELEDRIPFHCWLQLSCHEQLERAQAHARESGMNVGVMHDLAVGVDIGGADAWSDQDTLATDVSVGAPPDSYNQLGQDWQQPPWRPDRLAESGYAAYRDMVRATLRHAGGVRIDHVLGLFRLWWIPAGSSPRDGTYVRYDAEAMLGILALEAHRAGAIVVGEDLGTIPPGVRDSLAQRCILGSTVLWFERGDDGTPNPPEQWREFSLATVATHDLPTVVGLLELSHVDLRARLGLLDRPAEEERAEEAAVCDAWLQLARERGLLGDDSTVEDQVVALHALLTQSPSRLVAAGLTELVGDPRQQNQPGTTDEYPNWCLPLARKTANGVVPVGLEDALADPLAARLAALFAERIG
jgi:4-alpha-glucanotransferase